MTTQMLTKYLNRGRISYLMAYALSAKKQQYSLISINSHDILTFLKKKSPLFTSHAKSKARGNRKRRQKDANIRAMNTNICLTFW